MADSSLIFSSKAGSKFSYLKYADSWVGEAEVKGCWVQILTDMLRQSFKHAHRLKCSADIKETRVAAIYSSCKKPK